MLSITVGAWDGVIPMGYVHIMLILSMDEFVCVLSCELYYNFNYRCHSKY